MFPEIRKGPQGARRFLRMLFRPVRIVCGVVFLTLATKSAGELAEPHRALLARLMAEHQVPGVSMLGIVDRKIAWEHHAGVRAADEDAAVDAGTVFEAASMTKPVAAYAAILLAQQGRLDLDAPLAASLDAPFAPDEPLHARITARMAMCHTSGFPNWRRGQPLRVRHQPGTAFRYSGEGYVFLQRVVERVTGTDLDSHLRTTLFGPLGMSASRLVWDETYETSAAAGHDAAGAVKPERRLYRRPNAAYTLYTTPRDYARFLLEMMNSDRTAPHSLDAAHLALMLTPASPPTGRDLIARQGSLGEGEMKFALGWQIEPTASGPRFRHSGSNGTGFRCYSEFDPATGAGLVIMTNAEGGRALWQEMVAAISPP